MTRPSADEVGRYRAHVDQAVTALLRRGADEKQAEIVELGLNHEQQHQELLVMDALHLLSRHPFGPALLRRPAESGPDGPEPLPLTWRAVRGGLQEVGHDGTGFPFDNEGPRSTACT